MTTFLWGKKTPNQKTPNLLLCLHMLHKQRKSLQNAKLIPFITWADSGLQVAGWVGALLILSPKKMWRRRLTIGRELCSSLCLIAPKLSCFAFLIIILPVIPS